MEQTRMKIAAAAAFIGIAVFGLTASSTNRPPRTPFEASTIPTPTPEGASTPVFDQAAALARLKAQIKGRENEAAPTVFKNVQTMTGTTAGRLLAVMEFGFARSLGVNCTHCHVPDKWESEEKPQKQIARDMSAMVTRINKELLRNIKNLRDPNPIVNCTTCHRGEVKPALNLPTP